MLYDSRLQFAQDEFNSMSNDDAQRVWNEYCDANGQDDKVYENDEENVEEMLCNLTKKEVLELARYSSYDETDTYVRYDGSDLETSEEVRYLIDDEDEDFLEYLIANELKDKMLDAFKEFVNENLEDLCEDEDEDELPSVDVEECLMEIFETTYCVNDTDWDTLWDAIKEFINEGK